jgi:hypothetical protein
MMKKTQILFGAVVWGFLIVPAILLASGCDRFGLVCTQIGCDDGVNISIRGLEVNQSYEVDLETADETIKCTIDMSEDTTDDARMTCDRSLFYFSRMDGAHIELAGTPERVAITVRQNGAMIVQDEVAPEYQEFAPNGEACGPICLQDAITVEL